MDNTTPAAPAPASDATPNTNSNTAPAETPQAPTEPQASAITPEAVAEYLGTTPEGLESFTKFSKANGGLDKAFGKMKQTISNPQPQPQAQNQQPEPLNDNILQTPQVMAQQPIKPAEGYLSVDDIARLQYNKMLSEAYPELDKDGYITTGDFVKEAASMGIPVMDQAGNMNNKDLRKFLDLKKATIPPAPASTPITTTPTVTYTTVEGDITTQEQADKILSEGKDNPQYAKALQYTQERIFGKKSEPKQK